MAGWMATGSFALLVIIVLLLLACLVILIIKLVEANTGSTGSTISSSSSSADGILLAQQGQQQQQLQHPAVGLSLGVNNGAFYGSGVDGNGDFTNRSELNMTKDAFYNNLRLDNSTLHTNGFRLFVAGTLSMINNSVIQNPGLPGGVNNAFGKGPVPGGLGGRSGKDGKPGTLGGGGDGGNGYLKDGTMTQINGLPSANALWGTNTSLFRGSDGTNSSTVLAYGAGNSGLVTSQSLRTKFDAVSALNASFIPTAPLLSGGSGGGGGQGASSVPGSGGGGGGGVVVIAAKNFQVGQGGGSINVSGGNGGALADGGPFHATSGGGGGGGLILLVTPSPPESYEGLVMNVEGGLSIDNTGRTIKAQSGRAINWFLSTESDSNPSQYLVATTASPQTMLTAHGASAVQFHTISHSLGIDKDGLQAVFTPQQSGLYMISAELPILALDYGSVNAYVVKNGDPTSAVYGLKTIRTTDKITIFTVVPILAKETFEIRAEHDTPSQSITINPGANLAVFLLSPI